MEIVDRPGGGLAMRSWSWRGETIFSVDDLHRLLTAEIAGAILPVTAMRGAEIKRLVVVPVVDD